MELGDATESQEDEAEEEEEVGVDDDEGVFSDEAVKIIEVDSVVQLDGVVGGEDGQGLELRAHRGGDAELAGASRALSASTCRTAASRQAGCPPPMLFLHSLWPAFLESNVGSALCICACLQSH